MSKYEKVPQPDGTWIIKKPSVHYDLGVDQHGIKMVATKGGEFLCRVSDRNVDFVPAAVNSYEDSE